jgi:hypothetical protein
LGDVLPAQGLSKSLKKKPFFPTLMMHSLL